MPVRPPFVHALLSRAPQKKTKQPPPHVKAPALGFPLRHRAQSEGGLGGGPPRQKRKWLHPDLPGRERRRRRRIFASFLGRAGACRRARVGASNRGCGGGSISTSSTYEHFIRRSNAHLTKTASAPRSTSTITAPRW